MSSECYETNCPFHLQIEPFCNESTCFQFPVWLELSKRHERGDKLNPIEKFIFNNEPAESEEEIEWRYALASLVSYVANKVRRDLCNP